MLAQFAKTAVGSLGLRVGASALVAESSPALQLLATRGYAKGEWARRPGRPGPGASGRFT